MSVEELNRCAWCGTAPIYLAYHDTEWGVPLHNERALFEFLILEGAQAGLERAQPVTGQLALVRHHQP